MIEMPSYTEVADGLANYHKVLSPSEIHGQLCGYIVAGSKMNGIAWMEPESIHSHPELFMKLYQASYQQIKAFATEFDLLLPHSVTPLPDRAHALGDWCRGFSNALCIAGLEPSEGYLEETNDAIIHIAEVADIDYHDLKVCEEDETAFLELAEYIRFAVLMIYANTSGFASTKFDMMPTSEDTIH